MIHQGSEYPKFGGGANSTLSVDSLKRVDLFTLFFIIKNKKSMDILIKEEEILANPNYYKLGEMISKRYWHMKKSIDDTVSVRISPEYVSEDGFDLCVICGKKSPYYSHASVDLRVGYIDGAGQSCFQPTKCDIYK